MPMPRIMGDHDAMGRRKRPHAPGMVFHLVTRLHRREPLFVEEVRDEVAALIRRMIGRTDAQLLGYAVMPNHVHVLLRQGPSTLGTIMQPLLRRVALRVQAAHGLEGSIVERRYRDRLCASPDHVREAIMYVHLNPYRAGLCGRDLDYPATTHQAYLPGSDPLAHGIDPDAQLAVLELFGQAGGRSRDELCVDYGRWLDWRLRREPVDPNTAGDQTGEPAGWAPDRGPGNRAWRRHFAPAVRSVYRLEEPLLPDLRDFVLAQLSVQGSGYTVDQLTGSWLPRDASRSRARLIRAAAHRGYKTGRLADFFAISPAAVSMARYAPIRPGEDDRARPISVNAEN